MTAASWLRYPNSHGDPHETRQGQSARSPLPGARAARAIELPSNAPGAGRLPDVRGQGRYDQAHSAADGRQPLQTVLSVLCPSIPTESAGGTMTAERRHKPNAGALDRGGGDSLPLSATGNQGLDALADAIAERVFQRLTAAQERNRPEE